MHKYAITPHFHITLYTIATHIFILYISHEHMTLHIYYIHIPHTYIHSLLSTLHTYTYIEHILHINM